VIAAIQTQYNGLLFRSRLEARWAVFFDTCGIKYCYESEGFSLPSGNYLPDFYIPNQPSFRHNDNGLFVEVKGVATDKSHSVLDELAMHTGIDCVMLGELPYGEYEERKTEPESPFLQETLYLPALEKEWTLIMRHDEGRLGPVIGGDSPYVWCQCPFCGMFGFEFDGRSARIGCGCRDHITIRNGDKTYNSASLDLREAYQVARSERFEDWRAA
jgi:hypothetical protein